METVAKRIADIEREAGEGEANGGRFVYRVADPAIWQETGANKAYRSMADIFSSYGIHFTRGDNRRLQGKVALHEHLKWQDPTTGREFTPRLRFFRNCVHMIRTLPSLTYDEVHVEDVNTRSEDHAFDDCRYFVMIRPMESAKELEKPPERDWFLREIEKEMAVVGYGSQPESDRDWLFM